MTELVAVADSYAIAASEPCGHLGNEGDLLHSVYKGEYMQTDDLEQMGLQAGTENAIDIVASLVKNPRENAIDGASLALKRIVAGKYKEALVEPLQLLVEKGKIRKECADSAETYTRLHSVFECIDGQPLEQEKFEAIRNLFLNGLLEEEDPLHHVMMRTLTNMPLEEILVLNALGDPEVVKYVDTPNQPAWLEEVCTKSRMLHPPLIMDIGKSLEGKLLARERMSCYLLTSYGTGLRDMMSTKWSSEEIKS